MPFLEFRVVVAVRSRSHWPCGVRRSLPFSGPWWQFARLWGAWAQNGDGEGCNQGDTQRSNHKALVSRRYPRTVQPHRCILNRGTKSPGLQFESSLWMQVVEGIGRAEGWVGRLCNRPSEWWLECGSGKGNEDKWIGFGIVREKIISIWGWEFGWDERGKGIRGNWKPGNWLVNFM